MLASLELPHPKVEGGGDENVVMDVWHSKKDRVRNEIIREK